MNKIDLYINNLQKGAGIDKALRIAEARMKASDPSNWNSLPHGPIFFPTDHRQKTGYREKHLKKLHNWWSNLYYTMKKRHKK